MAYRSFVLAICICLLLAAATNGQEEREQVACENESMKIVCDWGTRIVIVQGFYGRTSNRYCAHGPRLTYQCSSPYSDRIVYHKCYDKRVCLINSSNYEFGDPCFGTTKYLRVRYFCWKRWY